MPATGASWPKASPLLPAASCARGILRCQLMPAGATDEPDRARLSVPPATVPGMGKSSAEAALYQCSECGWKTTRWAGRCGECQQWGTVAETRLPARERLLEQARNGSGRGGLGRGGHAGGPRPGRRVGGPGGTPTTAVRIADVDPTTAQAQPTGLGELDRVLGGGLVPGAVVLLAGEPGVGKSTLLLEAAALVAESGPVLYVTGEESAAQVRMRADRIGAVSQNLFLAAETDMGALLEHVEAVQPRLLIVDSVQTISVDGVEGVPGGVP